MNHSMTSKKIIFAITFLMITTITPTAFAIDTVPLPENKIMTDTVKGIIIIEGRYFDTTLQKGSIIDWSEVQMSEAFDRLGYTPNPDTDICLIKPDLCPKPECNEWWCPDVNPCKLGLSCPEFWSIEMQYLDIINDKTNVLGNKIFNMDERLSGVTTDWRDERSMGVIVTDGYLLAITSLVGIAAIASIITVVRSFKH